MGNTPLHMASFFGQIDCAGILIEAGANTTLQNDMGAYPFSKPNEGTDDCEFDINLEFLTTFRSRNEIVLEDASYNRTASWSKTWAYCDEGWS